MDQKGEEAIRHRCTALGLLGEEGGFSDDFRAFR